MQKTHTRATPWHRVAGWEDATRLHRENVAYLNGRWVRVGIRELKARCWPREEDMTAPRKEATWL